VIRFISLTQLAHCTVRRALALPVVTAITGLATRLRALPKSEGFSRLSRIASRRRYSQSLVALVLYLHVKVDEKYSSSFYQQAKNEKSRGVFRVVGFRLPSIWRLDFCTNI